MKKGAIAVILITFLLGMSIVFSQNINVDVKVNKVDEEVEELLEDQDEVSVIVVLEDDSSVLDEMSASELNEKDDLEKKKIMVAEQQEKVLSELDLKEEKEEYFDFGLESQFSVVNGFSGNLTQEGLEKLALDPNVKKIYPNRPVSAFLSDSKDIVNASNTWTLIHNSTNITGKGEVICIIDTGVDYTHSDMGNCASTSNINDGSCNKVIGGYDFVNNDENPIDDEGHGTHVAGIAASSNGTYRGIAPDANIIAIKSLNSAGSGSTQDIIDGIDWCVNNASIFNISIISMSLGTTTLFTSHCDNDDPSVGEAIDAAIAKNISVIASTGNAGSTTGIGSPACIKNSTAVGATDKNNAITYNRNSITDLLGPGVNIVSLKNGGGTTTLSGTSMSAPHVAGAFALLKQFKRLESNINLSPSTIEDALNDTGKQVNDTSNSGFFFSRINILAALLSIERAPPTVTSASITSTDSLNRTNGTLQAIFSFTDQDDDAITDNETLWYNNTVLIENLTNQTIIDSVNTTKGQNWTFSVRVFDGNNWSDWLNSTNLTINNAAPELNITDTITINETQLANITTNASDKDNDALTFTINDSRFNLVGIHFIYSTNLSDSEIYSINITVNDTELIDSKIITLNIIDVRDLDNDGNPDFNDTDDDNDGIADENDFLSGNLSSINTTSTINIKINGTTNLSKLFNQTVPINITNGTQPIVEFNFTFSETSTLDLGSITLNRTTNGSSAVSIRGINLTSINITKTIFLEKSNSSVTSVCIKDLDVGFDNISSACNADNEFLINCDNQTSNGYACFDTGTRYKITGLNHSAIIERCEDKDGDSYGTYCSLGSDCDDNDASKNTDCSSSSSSSSGGGGGGSSGGSSGGGGGGSGVSYTCNMDWNCTTWSACENSWQTRQCDFVKVTQHTQSEQCPLLTNVPEMAIKCEIQKAIEEKISNVTQLKAQAKEEIAETKQVIGRNTNPITGLVTGILQKIKNNKTGSIVVGSIVVIGLLIYFKIFAPKKPLKSSKKKISNKKKK